jgi:hypothetical protein
MNNWFTVGVKYTKQEEDGTFRRVSEPYLVAAMIHGEAEARIFEELGSTIRGEFQVTKVAKTEIHDIFHYDDADLWFKSKISYETTDEEGTRSKKIAQNFLVSAHSVKDAYERLNESLSGLMIDYFIQKIEVSPIIDIFPFTDQDNQPKNVE